MPECRKSTCQSVDFPIAKYSSLADWVKKADAAGPAPDANPFQMAEDLHRLKRENERLKRENEILLKASAFFASRQL